MQLAVGEAAHVAALGFEHQRGMVAARGEVHVEAVVRDIELAIGEPAVVGGVAVVQRAGEGLVPHQCFAGLRGPEAFGVMRGLLVQAMQFVAAGAGAMREVMRGREAAGLGERGFDGFVVHAGDYRVSRTAWRRSRAPNPLAVQKDSMAARSGGRRRS